MSCVSTAFSAAAVPFCMRAPISKEECLSSRDKHIYWQEAGRMPTVWQMGVCWKEEGSAESPLDITLLQAHIASYRMLHTRHSKMIFWHTWIACEGHATVLLCLLAPCPNPGVWCVIATEMLVWQLFHHSAVVTSEEPADGNSGQHRRKLGCFRKLTQSQS